MATAPVHPRVRGEHEQFVCAFVVAVGSSPRAWGTPRLPFADGLAFRFIPACAGNTIRRGAQPMQTTVHPRVRGEHRDNARRADLSAGSSPRARGTLGIAELAIDPTTVHPRVRGEHDRSLRWAYRQTGSSPRARGTRRCSVAAPCARRFIPACAGNTHMKSLVYVSAPVHPRVRGEHNVGYAQFGNAVGSSPRARGTLWFAAAAVER